MFVGHLGVGLALSARSRQFRLGTLLGAVLLLDVLLGVFVLAGWEHVIVPPDFASGHYLEFDFPYSHGLLATLGWSVVTAVLAGEGVLLLGRGGAAAWVAGGAVASHWVCDVIEHVRGLPLPGPGSPRVGFGLWSAMGWALVLEVVLLVAGASLFVRSRPGLPRGRLSLLLGVLGILAILQVVGQLVGTEVPPPRALAMTWLVQAALLTALGLWADPAVRSRAGSGSAGPPA